jgi:dethiobiotin synthetase
MPSPSNSLLRQDVTRAFGPGLFVTGTDTGVGKTLVSCALIRGLRDRGLDVAAMKPIETGVGPAGPLDAIALREAAGASDLLTDVCPQQFALPAAPNVAAAAECRAVDLAAITSAFGRLSAGRDLVVVEGAGGLLVPIAEGFGMLELARRLGLPALIVARAALGTINHTLLTLQAAEIGKLDVIGVVISHSGGELSHADSANLAELRRELSGRLVGEVPALAAGAVVPAEIFDLDAIVDALRSPRR